MPPRVENPLLSSTRASTLEAALRWCTAASAGAAASASAMALAPAAVKRVMREMRQLSRKPHPAMTVLPSDDDDSIAFWRVLLQGPDTTPYRGGVWLLTVQVRHSRPSLPASAAARCL